MRAGKPVKRCPKYDTLSPPSKKEKQTIWVQITRAAS